jgi:hypothetical protein
MDLHRILLELFLINSLPLIAFRVLKGLVDDLAVGHVAISLVEAGHEAAHFLAGEVVVAV